MPCRRRRHHEGGKTAPSKQRSTHIAATVSRAPAGATDRQYRHDRQQAWLARSALLPVPGRHGAPVCHQPHVASRGVAVNAPPSNSCKSILITSICKNDSPTRRIAPQATGTRIPDRGAQRAATVRQDHAGTCDLSRQALCLAGESGTARIRPDRSETVSRALCRRRDS